MSDKASRIVSNAGDTGAPDRRYEPAPDIFRLPQGVNFGPCSGVAVNSQRHMGKIMKLDAFGKVLGSTAAQGKGPNRYGEAHFLDVSCDEAEIFVADTLNWRVQRLVRR